MQLEPKFQKDWAFSKGIQKLLSSSTLFIGLHFLFDLLEGLKKFSVIAQQSAGILIGKEQFRLDLLGFIFELTKDNGQHLTALLKDSICSDKNGRLCTAEEFLTASDVCYKSIELLMDSKASSFLEMRSKFLLSLLEEVKVYFPENTFKDFEIFLPKKLPRTDDTAMTYGHYAIQTIAERFDLDPEVCRKEWVNN